VRKSQNQYADDLQFDYDSLFIHLDMIKALTVILFFSFINLMAFCQQKNSDLVIDFYSQKIEIKGYQNIEMSNFDEGKETIYDYIQKLKSKKLEVISFQFKQYKKQLILNDWLYYNLIKNVTDTLFHKLDKGSRNLITGYLMANEGYEIAIGVNKNRTSVNIWCEDKIYHTWFKKENNVKYINLNSIHNEEAFSDSLDYDLTYLPASLPSKIFSLSLESIYRTKFNSFVEKGFIFQTKDTVLAIDIKLNKSIIDILHNYPSIDYPKYFNVGVSEECYNSFMPYLKELIKEKTVDQQVRFLLSFVRTVTQYSENSKFENDHNMLPEEVFFYEYSDCEDKSALFYFLCKELLNLPLIVVDYYKHINVAINLPTPRGKYIEYKHKFYTICEPSDGEDLFEIGESHVELVHYKIIAESE
jgi:hypothetical protein